MFIIRDLKTNLLYDVEYNKKTDVYMLKQGDNVIRNLYPTEFRTLLYDEYYKRYDTIIDN